MSPHGINNYSEEDRARIREYLCAFTKPKIQALLDEADLPRTANKEDLLQRVRAALDDGSITYEHVVEVLDREVAWQSQHVFLFDSRGGEVTQWKDRTRFTHMLKRNDVEHLLDRKLPLIVDDQLAVCQILHDQQRVVVVAMDSHDLEKHLKELNHTETTDDGRTIEWRAFELRSDRGLVRFEWDFSSDAAMLQIAQRESGSDYNKVAKDFKALVGDWLPIDTLFANVNLSRTIALLREREQNGDQEVRCSAINLDVDGRSIMGRSSSGKTPFVGAKAVDDAFRGMLAAGAAHLGNVCWRPNTGSTPVTADVYTHVHAEAGCVIFSASTSEAIVRHVIGRIRFFAAQ